MTVRGKTGVRLSAGTWMGLISSLITAVATGTLTIISRLSAVEANEQRTHQEVVQLVGRIDHQADLLARLQDFRFPVGRTGYTDKVEAAAAPAAPAPPAPTDK